jgi:hypothetical protein
MIPSQHVANRGLGACFRCSGGQAYRRAAAKAQAGPGAGGPAGLLSKLAASLEVPLQGPPGGVMAAVEQSLEAALAAVPSDYMATDEPLVKGGCLGEGGSPREGVSEDWRRLSSNGPCSMMLAIP